MFRNSRKKEDWTPKPMDFAEKYMRAPWTYLDYVTVSTEEEVTTDKVVNTASMACGFVEPGIITHTCELGAALALVNKRGKQLKSLGQQLGGLTFGLLLFSIWFWFAPLAGAMGFAGSAFGAMWSTWQCTTLGQCNYVNATSQLLSAATAHFYGTLRATIFSVAMAGFLAKLHSLAKPVMGSYKQRIQSNFEREIENIWCSYAIQVITHNLGKYKNELGELVLQSRIGLGFAPNDKSTKLFEAGFNFLGSAVAATSVWAAFTGNKALGNACVQAGFFCSNIVRAASIGSKYDEWYTTMRQFLIKRYDESNSARVAAEMEEMRESSARSRDTLPNSTTRATINGFISRMQSCARATYCGYSRTRLIGAVAFAVMGGVAGLLFTRWRRNAPKAEDDKKDETNPERVVLQSNAIFAKIHAHRKENPSHKARIKGNHWEIYENDDLDIYIKNTETGKSGPWSGRIEELAGDIAEELELDADAFGEIYKLYKGAKFDFEPDVPVNVKADEADEVGTRKRGHQKHLKQLGLQSTSTHNSAGRRIIPVVAEDDEVVQIDCVKDSIPPPPPPGLSPRQQVAKEELERICNEHPHIKAYRATVWDKMAELSWEGKLAQARQMVCDRQAQLAIAAENARLTSELQAARQRLNNYTGKAPMFNSPEAAAKFEKEKQAPRTSDGASTSGSASSQVAKPVSVGQASGSNTRSYSSVVGAAGVAAVNELQARNNIGGFNTDNLALVDICVGRKNGDTQSVCGFAYGNWVRFPAHVLSKGVQLFGEKPGAVDCSEITITLSGRGVNEGRSWTTDLGKKFEVIYDGGDEARITKPNDWKSSSITLAKAPPKLEASLVGLRMRDGKVTVDSCRCESTEPGCIEGLSKNFIKHDMHTISGDCGMPLLCKDDSKWVIVGWHMFARHGKTNLAYPLWGAQSETTKVTEAERNIKKGAQQKKNE